MKFELPQEPNKELMDDRRSLWLSQFYRHIRGDTDWIAPTLLNSWVNFGSGQADAGYRLKNGIVYLQGLIKNGTTTGGTVLFNLPVGYRPLSQLIFSTSSNSAFGDFRINANGDVLVYVASATWLSLQCSFIAEQ